MDHYYILSDGSVVTSKWEKQPGDRHLATTVKQAITKEQYEAVVMEIERRKEIERRSRPRFNADLWLAGQILEAGKNVGIDVQDTIQVMADLAPKSLRELKKALSQ